MPSSPPPVASAAANPNPYKRLGTHAKFGFANGTETWSEEVDFVQVAAEALRKQGHEVAIEKTGLYFPLADLRIIINLAHMQPLHPKGANTTIIIDIQHSSFPIPPIFEYLHSTGKSVANSVEKGFDMWAKSDLVTILDAIKTKPTDCMIMNMEIAADKGSPARKRRMVLGPVTYVQLNPPTPAPEHPPFCACCLLTNTMKAFQPQINSGNLFAIRLFGMRDKDGRIQADCRINGEDYEPGKEALLQYVQEKWPDNGLEFRKQYVIIQNSPDIPPD